MIRLKKNIKSNLSTAKIASLILLATKEVCLGATIFDASRKDDNELKIYLNAFLGRTT